MVIAEFEGNSIVAVNYWSVLVSVKAMGFLLPQSIALFSLQTECLHLQLLFQLINWRFEETVISSGDKW